MNSRYEIIVDPFDRYVIWDRWRHTPAEWAGEPLIGLNSIIARAALHMLSGRTRFAGDRRGIEPSDHTMKSGTCQYIRGQVPLRDQKG